MLEPITINPEQCGGKPCIRGMRIRVTDVLELLANCLTQEQVVEELEIELEDVTSLFVLCGSRSCQDLSN